MENTVAEQIVRNSLTMMVSFVMVVRLALIVLAVKTMNMQNVHTMAALILKTQIKMKSTMSLLKKTWLTAVNAGKLIQAGTVYHNKEKL